MKTWNVNEFPQTLLGNKITHWPNSLTPYSCLSVISAYLFPFMHRNVSCDLVPACNCHTMFRWWHVCPFSVWCTSLKRSDIKAGMNHHQGIFKTASQMEN